MKIVYAALAVGGIFVIISALANGNYSQATFAALMLVLVITATKNHKS